MTTPSRAMHVATSYHVSSRRLTLGPEAAGANDDDDEDDVCGVDVLRHMSLSQPCSSGTLLPTRPSWTRCVNILRRCQRQA